MASALLWMATCLVDQLAGAGGVGLLFPYCIAIEVTLENSRVTSRDLLIGVSLSVFTVFMSSTISAMTKHLSATVHTAAIISVQYGLSLALIMPLVLRHGAISLKTQRPGMHLLRGVSGCACFYLYYYCLGQISLVEATLLRSSAPLMVPLLIVVGFGQRISRSLWIPLLVGFVGVMTILRPGFTQLSVWHLLALASGLGLALSMVSTRVLVESEPQHRILFYYFAISFAVSLPFFFLNYRPIPAEAWWGMIYIAVVAYLCFVMYTLAYRYVPASLLAPTSYFGVVFGGLMDWLIWHHVPDAVTVVGSVLVILGGVLVWRVGRESESRL